jgi:hypothetical protein
MTPGFSAEKYALCGTEFLSPASKCGRRVKDRLKEQMMAAITASMVAELRAKTDAPMMECKKALTEADGDMERQRRFDRRTELRNRLRLQERRLPGLHQTSGRTGRYAKPG